MSDDFLGGKDRASIRRPKPGAVRAAANQAATAATIVTKRSPTDAPALADLVRDSANPLIVLSLPLLQLAAALHDNPKPPPAQALHDEVLAEIEAFRSRLGAARLDGKVRERTEQTVVALMDDIIQAKPTIGAEWKEKLNLQQKLYGIRTFGDLVYDWIDNEINNSQRSLHLLELFYVCLRLNFMGKFGRPDVTNGKQEWQRATERLYDALRRQPVTGPLTPPPLAYPKSPGAIGRSLAIFFAPAAAMLLGLLFFLFGWLADKDVQAASERINAVSAQLPIPVAIDPPKLPKPAADIAEAAPQKPSECQKYQKIAGKFDGLDFSVVSETSTSVRLRAQAPQMFETLQAKLDPPEIANAFIQIAKAMADEDGELIVEGHTDERKITRPTRSQYQDNETLSKERANTVAELMKSYLKHLSISVDGKGGKAPIIKGATNEKDHALNRRVELILTRASQPQGGC